MFESVCWRKMRHRRANMTVDSVNLDILRHQNEKNMAHTYSSTLAHFIGEMQKRITYPSHHYQVNANITHVCTHTQIIAEHEHSIIVIICRKASIALVVVHWLCDVT